MEDRLFDLAMTMLGVIAAEALGELVEALKEKRKAKRKASAKAGKHAKRP